MRKKMASMAPEDVTTFASGCKGKLRPELTTPIIGTNCLILLVRGDETQNVGCFLTIQLPL